MLGFEVMIYHGSAELVRRMPYHEDETLLASWICAYSGIAWLNELVDKNQAELLGGDGYPYRYISVAKVIVPLIKNGPIKYEGTLVIGEDYILPPGWTKRGEFRTERLDACRPDDPIYIEAWDQS